MAMDTFTMPDTIINPGEVPIPGSPIYDILDGMRTPTIPGTDIDTLLTPKGTPEPEPTTLPQEEEEGGVWSKLWEGAKALGKKLANVFKAMGLGATLAGPAGALTLGFLSAIKEAGVIDAATKMLSGDEDVSEEDAEKVIKALKSNVGSGSQSVVNAFEQAYRDAGSVEAFRTMANTGTVDGGASPGGGSVLDDTLGEFPVGDPDTGDPNNAFDPDLGDPAAPVDGAIGDPLGQMILGDTPERANIEAGFNRFGDEVGAATDEFKGATAALTDDWNNYLAYLNEENLSITGDISEAQAGAAADYGGITDAFDERIAGAYSDDNRLNLKLPDFMGGGSVRLNPGAFVDSATDIAETSRGVTGDKFNALLSLIGSKGNQLERFSAGTSTGLGNRAALASNDLLAGVNAATARRLTADKGFEALLQARDHMHGANTARINNDDNGDLLDSLFPALAYESPNVLDFLRGPWRGNEEA